MNVTPKWWDDRLTTLNQHLVRIEILMLCLILLGL